MASNTLESPRAKGEEAKAPEAAPSADAKAEAPAAGGKGLKAWIPLVVAVVAMPALAFATTQFLLLPKLQRAIAQGNANAPAATPAAPAEAGAAPASGEKPASDKTKVTVTL